MRRYPNLGRACRDSGMLVSLDDRAPTSFGEMSSALPRCENALIGFLDGVESMRKLLLVLTALVCLPAVSQTPTGVDAALRAYAEATRTYDTSAMAQLMHPEALAEFREAIDSALRVPKSDAAKADLLPLFSLTKPEDCFKLSDAEAYKRLNDTVAKSAPQIAEMMSKAEYQIVGSVMKDEVAYVTYTLTMNIEVKPMSTQVVQRVKQPDGQWLLLLPSSSTATVAGIKARYQ